jgi:hypothetical protein
MKTSDSTCRISAAIGEVQKNMPTITATQKNDFLSTRDKEVTFAGLDDIWTGIRQVLSENGVIVLQGSMNPSFPGGYHTEQTRLQHTDGQFIEDDGVPLVNMTNAKDGGSMQAVGSSITYARRQGLTAMLGITISDEDDDGDASSKLPPRNESAKVSGKAADKKPPSDNKKAPPKVKGLNGPHKTLTALKEAGKALMVELNACGDMDTLTALEALDATKATMKQLKADFAPGFSYKRDDDGNVGLKERFIERHKELSE